MVDEPEPSEMAARRERWEAAQTDWQIRRQNAPRDREEFSVAEIGHALARRPGRIETDYRERGRIVIDLFDWIERGEFDEPDILMLVGGPDLFQVFLPEFRSVREDTQREGIKIWGDPDHGAGRPAIEWHVGQVRINIEALVLRRDALLRYLRGCGLEGAPRLLSEWFPEQAATVSRVQQAGRGGATSRRRPTNKQLDEWMAENVTAHAKRDPTIADCCRATRATVRAAKAAWMRLPKDKRRGRGKRDRNRTF